MADWDGEVNNTRSPNIPLNIASKTNQNATVSNTLPEIMLVKNLNYVLSWIKSLFLERNFVVPLAGRWEKHFINNWKILTQIKIYYPMIEGYKRPS